MLLVGMFDSPYVRRVAVSLRYLDIPFEHGNWSVGADFERISAYSPLGRVPVLVMDDATVLVDSAAILDTVDELVGPGRSLLPTSGATRREAQRLISLAIGAAEKAREQIHERLVRPPEKYHAPWVERCREQMHGALGLLETACGRLGGDDWLVGGRYSQADITVACIFTFLCDSLEVANRTTPYPSLSAFVERCEARPEFRQCYLRWFAAEMQ